MDTNIDVALILWNPDVIQLMSMVLWQRHLCSSGVEPSDRDQVQNLIEAGKPSVVVFDLEPPYPRSATALSELMGRASGSSFILTCADPALAVKFVPWLSDYRIFQKPYAIDELGQVIAGSIRHRVENLAMASGHV